MGQLSASLHVLREAFACQKIPEVPEGLLKDVVALACEEAEKTNESDRTGKPDDFLV